MRDFVLIQLLRYLFVISNHYHLFNMLKGCGLWFSYKTLFSLWRRRENDIGHGQPLPIRIETGKPVGWLAARRPPVWTARFENYAFAIIKLWCHPSIGAKRIGWWFLFSFVQFSPSHNLTRISLTYPTCKASKCSVIEQGLVDQHLFTSRYATQTP